MFPAVYDGSWAGRVSRIVVRDLLEMGGAVLARLEHHTRGPAPAAPHGIGLDDVSPVRLCEAHADYPFSAPNVSPRTMCFWTSIARISTGSVMIVAAAVSPPQLISS